MEKDQQMGDITSQNPFFLWWNKTCFKINYYGDREAGETVCILQSGCGKVPLCDCCETGITDNRRNPYAGLSAES